MNKRQPRERFFVLRVNDAERNQVTALARAMQTTPSNALRKLVAQAVQTNVIDTGAGIVRQDSPRAGAYPTPAIP